VKLEQKFAEPDVAEDGLLISSFAYSLLKLDERPAYLVAATIFGTMRFEQVRNLLE